MSPNFILLLIPLAVSSLPVSLIYQARSQAESLKSILSFVDKSPTSAEVVRSFGNRTNTCIENINDAIDIIDATTKLVEDAAGGIQKLFDTLDRVLRSTALDGLAPWSSGRQYRKLLRIVRYLAPKLTPRSYTRCSIVTGDLFGSLTSLAEVLTEIATTDTLNIPPLKQQSLKNSADILTNVATFLTKYRKQMLDYSWYSLCRLSNFEISSMVGPMVMDISQIYKDLGGRTAMMARTDQEYRNRISVSINIFCS